MKADERHEAADALDLLRSIDEGEHTDDDRLQHLARELREDADTDIVPKWLREMLGPKSDEERRKRRLDLIAEVIRLREQNKLMSEAGQIHAAASEEMRLTLGSLLDVVDELCMGLAVGQTPDREWAEQVSASLGEHRARLGFQKG